MKAPPPLSSYAQRYMNRLYLLLLLREISHEAKCERILFRMVIPMLALEHGIDALFSGKIEVRGVRIWLSLNVE